MKKKILVAPLNWGLGHATRCIPIINALLENNFEPLIASDGAALDLLRQEFPALTCLELPSYNIKYSKKGQFLKLKLIMDSPKFIRTIKAERKATKELIETHKIDGVVSDNRPGVYNKLVPSIYMTHQLRVLSGNTTWLSTKLHQIIIKRFDECWIPDANGTPNLSGKLGHIKSSMMLLKYLGPLSRFKKLDCEIRYPIMVLLSGPEPQRSMLEEKLLVEFKNYPGNILFVKGTVEKEQTIKVIGNIIIYNYMLATELEKALNESDMILSRSGYTTIMDLAKLGKKAFFIPTPGQFEQEYLATQLRSKCLVPSCNQDDFSLDKLTEVNNYQGLETFDYDVNYKKLFHLFEGK